MSGSHTVNMLEILLLAFRLENPLFGLTVGNRCPKLSLNPHYTQ